PMPAIITITLNPAIDKLTSAPVLIPEKKLRCSVPVFEPGGGGVNVARAIKKLGGNALAIYLAGGHTGHFFNQLLREEHVEALVTETHAYTRENLIVLETASNQQYRFGMPGPHIRETEWQDCLNNIEKQTGVEYIVASGSLPPGVPTDIYARIAWIANKKKARLIVDTSGEALKQAVHEGVYLIKPNLGELSSLAGKEVLQIESIDDLAIEIISAGTCEVIVVSMGQTGAMLVTKDLALQIVPPPVQRKSTVGAGDSMVAGIVMSLEAGKPLIDAVQYGVACGTAATMNSGTQLCRKEDVDRLFQLIHGKSPLQAI
ncbi:MAG TPA: 1-phosphofructokinase family hexose kinase, partial [Puia sp.]